MFRSGVGKIQSVSGNEQRENFMNHYHHSMHSRIKGASNIAFQIEKRSKIGAQFPVQFFLSSHAYTLIHRVYYKQRSVDRSILAAEHASYTHNNR